MGTRISAEAREQLVQVIGARYRGGSKEEKVRILDEFVAVTGFHRKHSIRVLNTSGESIVPRPPPRMRLYDQAVREALVVQYPDRLLRTLQRRLNLWRRAAARKLVFMTNDDVLATALR